MHPLVMQFNSTLEISKQSYVELVCKQFQLKPNSQIGQSPQTLRLNWSVELFDNMDIMKSFPHISGKLFPFFSSFYFKLFFKGTCRSSPVMCINQKGFSRENKELYF